MENLEKSIFRNLIFFWGRKLHTFCCLKSEIILGTWPFFFSRFNPSFLKIFFSKYTKFYVQNICALSDSFELFRTQLIFTSQRFLKCELFCYITQRDAILEQIKFDAFKNWKKAHLNLLDTQQINGQNLQEFLHEKCKFWTKNFLFIKKILVYYFSPANLPFRKKEKKILILSGG